MNHNRLNWKKYLKTLERKEKLLENNQIFIENKEELLIYLERFIILEKKLLIEKWWKLIEKNEECAKILANLTEIQDIISNEEIKKFLTIS